MTSDELAERVSEIRERTEATEGADKTYIAVKPWHPGGDRTPWENRVAHAPQDAADLLSVLDDVAEGLAGLHPNDDGWEALLFNVEHIGRIDEDVAGTLDAVRDLHQRRDGEGE